MDVRIRPMTMDDLPALQELLGDERVMRYLEPPFPPEKARAFLEQAGLSAPPRILAAEDEAGRFLGYVIRHPYDQSSMEIGWVLRPDAWGKGYASALTRLLVDEAERGGTDLVLECLPEQAATRRIAGKFGFEPAGAREELLLFRRACRGGKAAHSQAPEPV